MNGPDAALLLPQTNVALPREVTLQEVRLVLSS